MIERELSKKVKSLAKKMPIIAIVGPRQSGKTTLAKTLFKNKPYISFENTDVRSHALNDPRDFLGRYPKGAIFDEVQRAPELFSYLQGVVDEKDKPGMFILTGSQHFLLLEKVTQSLAGRVGILELLPFSLQELSKSKLLEDSVDEVIFKGLYPRIYDKNLNPVDWYADYIEAYLERDVRQITNIKNLSTFKKFLSLCAARVGQLLNLSSLAIECGITHTTAREWISILEASFIIYLLQPHHKNFNKRVVKMPKLYFYDTGLVCSLLNIENKEQLSTYPLRGNIFETFIMSELLKQRFNKGLKSNLYFWRDKTGHEVDCIVESAGSLTPIEIKSGKTINNEMFKNIEYWKKISGKSKNDSYLIYGGSNNQKRSGVNVLSWKDCNIL